MLLDPFQRLIFQTYIVTFHINSIAENLNTFHSYFFFDDIVSWSILTNEKAKHIINTIKFMFFHENLKSAFWLRKALLRNIIPLAIIGKWMWKSDSTLSYMRIPQRTKNRQRQCEANEFSSHFQIRCKSLRTFVTPMAINKAFVFAFLIRNRVQQTPIAILSSPMPTTHLYICLWSVNIWLSHWPWPCECVAILICRLLTYIIIIILARVFIFTLTTVNHFMGSCNLIALLTGMHYAEMRIAFIQTRLRTGRIQHSSWHDHS